MGRLFGTDGVRGIANQELTPLLAFYLGRAAAAVLGKGQKGVAILGRDTRLSGSMLAAALTAGVTSTGCDLLDAGVIPTPGIAYLTRNLGATFGVVISASHNPFDDNGIKFFSQEGTKLPDEVEDEIEALVLTALAGQVADFPTATGREIGRAESLADAHERWMGFLTGTATQDLSGLRIVVDCANGAASSVAPQVYRRLGAEVITINAEPDGVNINAQCGSTHPAALCQAVVAHQATVGLAHDGDADRVIAVDEQGRIVDGDGIMAICALDLLEKGKLAKGTLVATQYSNMGLADLLKRQGAQLLFVENGDRYVWEAMVQHRLNLGGEKSGHIIFADHSTTGDGILTAIQLLSVLKKKGVPLSQLASVLQFYPQKLVNVPVKDKNFAQNREVSGAIARAQGLLGEEGRIFVRASGTEPLIRVMAEAKDEQVLEEVVSLVAEVIAAQLGA